jgi:hypothetical protein
MKKKVAIVGMATTSRHLAPFDDDEFEIWCLNESYWGGHVGPDKKTPFLRRADRWFQMHPEWDYFRPHNFNHPLHPQWLRNDPWTEEELAAKDDLDNPLHKEFLSWGANSAHRRDVNFPIYMLEVDERIPGSTLYPMTDIVESFGINAENVHWFTNSFGFMCALAIYLGFEEIHIFGFEMSSQEEYGHQRACAVFWAGIAIGRGIKLVEPEGCRLLGQFDVLYGYDKIPGITKMHLEIERNAYTKQAQKEQAELNKILGEKERVEKMLNAAIQTKQKGRQNKLKKELEVLLNAQVKKVLELNAQNVARQIVEKHIRDLDGLPSPSDIQLIGMPGRIKVS